MNTLDAVKQLKNNYMQIAAALPWLDCHAPCDMAAAFADTPRRPDCNFIEAMPCNAPDIPAGALTFYRQSMQFQDSDFEKLMRNGNPVILRSDETELEKLGDFLTRHGDLTVILATGERKILYYFQQIRELLTQYKNFYLCTANFCNWDGLERLCALGFAERLLYGSFMPLYDLGASQGPLVMADLPWSVKSMIAGNNLRKLLNMPPQKSTEVKLDVPKAFIIDAHTHTALAAEEIPFEGPVNVPWNQWQKFMDKVGVEIMLTTPCEALHYSDRSSLDSLNGLCAESGSRVKFFEAYDPRDVEGSVRILEKSLPLADCIGIKIHPSSHKIKADDERYRPAFAMAEKYHKPIMSHTWAISSYNPNQIYSLPELFEKYLREFPTVDFIFGHTGGRPESFEETVRLLCSYSNAYCDIAGDYFHNGFIDHLLRRVSVDRILFGSDVNWIDPRCQIGQLFNSQADAETLERIFRSNAQKLFNL